MAAIKASVGKGGANDAADVFAGLELGDHNRANAGEDGENQTDAQQHVFKSKSF